MSRLETGSLWDRKGNEIDIVAYNQKQRKIFIGEIKWTNSLAGADVLDNLIEKSKLVNFSGSYQYVLISKSGFTEECIIKMKKLNAMHLDLNEITKLFNEAR